VIDQAGIPLTGAHISIRSSRAGGISDYRGAYRVSGLNPGNYEAMVTYIGYDTVFLPFSIEANRETTGNITMQARPYLAETAVITANRVEVSRNIIPMTVSQVDRNTLENSGESNLLPVVARQVPGVFVTERGVTGFGVAEGAAGNIRIRGIGGSPNTQVLVLVDGHPQYMGIFGHPLPDTYIASDAERVEVVRGPASVLYGSNAMGGAINVITRQQAAEGISLQGTVGYGMYNTLKVNGSAGVRIKKFQAFLSVNRDQTDGHRDNSDFSITNGYLKLSYDLNSHFRIWGDASLARYSSTNPGPVGSTDTTYQIPTHWQEIFRGFASVAVENSYYRSQGAAKFYYNWGEHQLYDGFLSYDKNYGLMLYQALKLFEGNTITIGYDFASSGGEAKNMLPAVPVEFVDTLVREQAGYVLAQQELFGRLTLMAGLRLQYNDMFKTAWIPHFGISWKAGGTTTLRTTISKGFRNPTIRELFMFRPANPDLDPESMWNYELGVVQKLLDNKFSLELTGFYSRGSNLIEVTGIPPDVQNRNTGSFEHFGAEFQGRWMIREDLSLLANYSYLHTDKPTLASPAHNLYLEGDYRYKNLSFRLSGQYIHNLITQTDPEISGNYFLLSARASYTYRDIITFFIDGSNLLDQDYEINYGYPMPGATVFGGVTVRWKKQRM
jgi:iron complex outermembrane receptor protein